MSLFSLDGRVAVVTGGSQGIGLATARALGVAGASVVVAARRNDLVEAAVDELKGLGVAVTGVACDVTDRTQVQSLVDAATSTFGPVDILVNNVGGSFDDTFRAGLLLDMTEAELLGVIRQNVTSMMNCCWTIVPGMLTRGSGSIVNVSSIVVRHPRRGLGFYSASKAAVANLTLTMATEWAPSVRVNAVVPGYIDTARTAPLRTPEDRTWLGDHIAMGRLGGPDDVAGAAVYLASSAAGWVTGATIEVDGGVAAI